MALPQLCYRAYCTFDHSVFDHVALKLTGVRLKLLYRLDMLETQCGIWPDAIAAVVYAPTLGGRLWSAEDSSLAGQGLGVALSRLDAFHSRMEAQGREPCGDI